MPRPGSRGTDRRSRWQAAENMGEQGQTYYRATAGPAPPAPPLQGEIRADICIIGGGLTGVSAALHLAERGADAVLLEAGELGAGASGRNGGQVGTGLNWSQARLEAKLGQDWARALWRLAEDAKALVRDRIARHGIACDLRPGIAHLAHRRRLLDDYRRAAAHLQDGYGYDAIRFVDAGEAASLTGSAAYSGGTLDLGAMHLHPLNLLLGLARAAVQAGAHLHQHSAVLAVERAAGGFLVRTASGRVRADRLVVACNGYRGGLLPEIGGRVLPIDNFILTTVPLPAGLAPPVLPTGIAVADSRYAVNYFRRTADNRLLFGGGENAGGPQPADLKAFVAARMRPVFPQLRDVAIDHAWAGTLAITASRLPEFGMRDGRLYYAHGYSGHGLALSVLAGRLLAGVMTGPARAVADGGANGGADADWQRLARLQHLPFPGGQRLRRPLLFLALAWFRLLDRL